MKNIDEILKAYGVEVPADKVEEFKAEFNANYKTVAELEKKNKAYTALEEKLNTTTEALKKFEGVNPEDLNNEIAKLQSQLKESDDRYAKEMHMRDFNDAIEKELAKIKFSSDYARDAIRGKLTGDAVTYKEGKLYGFADRLAELRESEPQAFVSEAEENKVKFTSGMSAQSSGNSGGFDKAEYAKLKDSVERQKYIREHSDAFAK